MKAFLCVLNPIIGIFIINNFFFNLKLQREKSMKEKKIIKKNKS